MEVDSVSADKVENLDIFVTNKEPNGLETVLKILIYFLEHFSI